MSEHARLLVEHLVQDHLLGAAERQLAAEHLVEDDPEAVDVAAAVHVVADHCTDATAARARAAGAHVHERAAGPAGKGAAIRWFLDAADDDLAAVDALVILDADSRLRPGALEPLVAALDAGAGAAQGFVWPLPADDSTACGPPPATGSRWS